MSTYVIGDIHGCYATLKNLLKEVSFSSHDRLWLVGDLVNRGPSSLEVLRWAADLGDRLTCVLGNHDLHLLSQYYQYGSARRSDTLDPVLGAPDADELMQWLQVCPLFHRQDNWIMVHAGLPPQWTLTEAMQWATRAATALKDPAHRQSALGRTDKTLNHPNLAQTSAQQVSFAVSAFTRLRMCTADGTLNFSYNEHPDQAPADLVPWFDLAHPDYPTDTQVVFGHWAALGLLTRPGLWGLDSGCAWGEKLTALQIDTKKLTQVPLADSVRARPD